MSYVPDIYKQLEREIVQLKERILDLEQENKQIQNLRKTNRQLRVNIEDLRVSETVFTEEIKRLNQIIKKQNLQAQQIQQDYGRIKGKPDMADYQQQLYRLRLEQDQDFKPRIPDLRNEKVNDNMSYGYQAKNKKSNDVFGINENYQQFKYQPKVQRPNRKQVTDDRRVFEKLNESKLIDLLRGVDVFSNLQWIYLNNNKITDHGLREIVSNSRKLSQVSEIYLSENQITDQGLKVFAVSGDAFPRLKHVGLNQNQIKDDGFRAFFLNIGKFKLLQTIGFQNNQITNQGLNAFANRRQNFQNLKRIYLSGNKFSLQGLQQVRNQFRVPFEIVN